MSIFNIHDHRTNDNIHFCDAVFEVFYDRWQDLGLDSNTQNFSEWVDNRSIYDIIMYAQRFSGMVTVYLYDPNYIVRNHGHVTAWHYTLKKHPLNPAGYDRRLLRDF